jgi:Rrf2 family nitric oxide-sensitive transcriptional repressor
MQLTKWTDYSLRVLMHCAAHGGRDRLVTISEIQQAHDISRHHLTKVVMSLAALGYLETTRGRGGGMRLMRAPGEIRVGEVVRDTETDFRLLECFDPAVNTCRLDGHCRLKHAVQEATARFLGVLDGITLAALVASPMTPSATPARVRTIALPVKHHGSRR